MLCLLVNIGFQILFHSPPGVLFTFPSRYSFTIGHQVVFSLTGWSPLIHTRFHVPRATLDTASSAHFSYTGLSPPMVCFSKTILLNLLNRLCSPNPKKITFLGLGSSYFARHYSRNRFFFLFLWVLRCFSSPRSLLMSYFTHSWIIRILFLIEFPHSEIYGLVDICSYP